MASITAMFLMASSSGDRNFSVFQNGFGERIALQGVLIADGEGFRGDASAEEVAAVVDEEASGAVDRRVEGDFDLNASARAEEVDALVGDQLRAAGEDGLAARGSRESLR